MKQKPQKFIRLRDVVKDVVANLDDKTIVLTPVVWFGDDPDTAVWCFYACRKEKGEGFVYDAYQASSRDGANTARAAFMLGGSALRGIVVVDTDDELEAAKLCATLWPCAKTAGMVRLIETERKEIVH